MTCTSNSPIRASIIIPFYNAEPTLQQCLQSIVEQDYKENYEIIAVDNKSTDQGRGIADSFINVITISQHEKQGICPTRNAGVKIARGEILVFFDADQVAQKDYLTILLRSTSQQEYGAFASKNIAFEETDSVLSDYWKTEWSLDSANKNELDKFSGGNFAMRKSVFDTLGGFDNELLMCEDFDLAWRMQKQLGLKIKYELESISYHYERATVKSLVKREYNFGIGEVQLSTKFPEIKKSIFVSLFHILKRTFLGLAALCFKLLKLCIGKSSLREMHLLLLDIYLQWVHFLGITAGKLKFLQSLQKQNA